MCPGGSLEESCQLSTGVESIGKRDGDQLRNTARLKARPSLMLAAHEMVMQMDGTSSKHADEVVLLSPVFQFGIEKYITELQCVETYKRYQAAESLASMGPRASGAVPALLKCLRQDCCVFVRKSAALALGEIGVMSAQVLAELGTAVSEDDNPYVRERAEQALHKLKC